VDAFVVEFAALNVAVVEFGVAASAEAAVQAEVAL